MTKYPATKTPWHVGSGAVWADPACTVLVASINRDQWADPYTTLDKRKPNPIQPVERDSNAHFIAKAVNNHHPLRVALMGMLEAYAPRRDFKERDKWHNAVQFAQNALEMSND